MLAYLEDATSFTPDTVLLALLVSWGY